MHRQRTPEQKDVDDWRLSASYAITPERQQHFTALADAYQPIVAAYERCNKLRKRIWALGVAVDEIADVKEAIMRRIAELTLERQRILTETGVALKVANKKFNR